MILQASTNRPLQGPWPMGLVILLTLTLFGVQATIMAAEFSHEDFDTVLRTFVRDDGQVDYKGLKANRAQLDDYIRRMGGVKPDDLRDWPTTDQIAFYINAYNAITLKRIIDHYPPKGYGLIYPKISIRNISGVWDELTDKVAGRRITLEQIEHEILRKHYNEPRIHVAIVCASISCPPLRAEAFVGERLDDQLNDQARRFARDTSKNRIDSANGVIYLSPIFEWFEKDFEGFTEHIPKNISRLRGGVGFLALYMNDKDAQFLRTGNFRVKTADYDWALNDLP